LHENSIPKIGCHYFWPGLIALAKNTPTYSHTKLGYNEKSIEKGGKKKGSIEKEFV
jgi:hypothetical protein